MHHHQQGAKQDTRTCLHDQRFQRSQLWRVSLVGASALSALRAFQFTVSDRQASFFRERYKYAGLFVWPEAWFIRRVVLVGAV